VGYQPGKQRNWYGSLSTIAMRFNSASLKRLFLREARPVFRLGHPKGLVSGLTLCEPSA